MELRPRKGRSAQTPSTPTVAKPSPRHPPHTASRKKAVSVPSSPILIPSDHEDIVPKHIHEELEASYPTLKQGDHADTPLSDFVKSRRKALSSTVKQNKKAASTVKKKSTKVSFSAKQDTTPMEEACLASDFITTAVEKERLDDSATYDAIAVVEDAEGAEIVTDNVYSDTIQLDEEKSARKGRKLESAKKKNILNAGSGSRRVREETQKGEVTHEVGDDELDPVDEDQEHDLLADAPVVVVSDECHHTLSLMLSDDETAQEAVSEGKALASTLEVPKATSKKKFRFKKDLFNEESLSRKLFEETAAITLSPTRREPADDFKLKAGKVENLSKEDGKKVDNEKIEKVDNEKIEKSTSEEQCESLKETDQSDIEMLENDEDNLAKLYASVEGENFGNKGTQSNVLEELSHRSSNEDEDIGSDHADVSELKLERTEGDAVHNEQFVITDDDNDSCASSGSDEDEGDLASIFVSSMKAHLHISESSKSAGMQSEQDVQKGRESPFTKDAVKGSHRNGNNSRSASNGLSWLPKVSLSDSKNRRSPQARFLETRPNSIWKKDQSLKDALCVPPVDPTKLNKLARTQKKDTTGDKWYNLSAPTITPELKKELQLVKLRGVLDPKRHYKAEDSKGLPKYFQVGTVVGSSADFYSGRLTKKEQKGSLANELLSDSSLSAFRKRKYLEIQDQKQAGGKGFFKKKKSKRTPAWAKI